MVFWTMINQFEHASRFEHGFHGLCEQHVKDPARTIQGARNALKFGSFYSPRGLFISTAHAGARDTQLLAFGHVHTQCILCVDETCTLCVTCKCAQQLSAHGPFLARTWLKPKYAHCASLAACLRGKAADPAGHLTQKKSMSCVHFHARLRALLPPHAVA
jgi:hypothetical protein